MQAKPDIHPPFRRMRRFAADLPLGLPDGVLKRQTTIPILVLRAPERVRETVAASPKTGCGGHVQKSHQTAKPSLPGGQSCVTKTFPLSTATSEARRVGKEGLRPCI